MCPTVHLRSLVTLPSAHTGLYIHTHKLKNVVLDSCIQTLYHVSNVVILYLL